MVGSLKITEGIRRHERPDPKGEEWVCDALRGNVAICGDLVWERVRLDLARCGSRSSRCRCCLRQAVGGFAHSSESRAARMICRIRLTLCAYPILVFGTK